MIKKGRLDETQNTQISNLTVKLPHPWERCRNRTLPHQLVCFQSATTSPTSVERVQYALCSITITVVKGPGLHNQSPGIKLLVQMYTNCTNLFDVKRFFIVSFDVLTRHQEKNSIVQHNNQKFRKHINFFILFLTWGGRFRSVPRDFNSIHSRLGQFV